MLRAAVLFVVIALGAGACAGDAQEVVESEPATEGEAAPVADVGSVTRTEGETEAGDPQGEAEQTAPAERVTEAQPEALAEPVADCGFGAGVEVEAVEVVQVEGDEREPTPSALQGGHPDFPDPLIDPDAIFSGGPPPDGIPPLDRPRFQTAQSVNWLRCNEPVLSLTIDGDARAYPLQIMTWHEIVNDTFGDVPVSVSFCPLCNSALVYRRDVGDRVLDFGTSGMLFNSSLVMYDRQTESLWTHFDGTAVVGTLTGQELELLPVQTTSWESFLRRHPEGTVLSRDTGYTRSYGTNPYSGYDNVGDEPFLFRGALDRRLLAMERVVAIGQRVDPIAIVLEHLATEAVVSVEVDGRALTVWHLPGTASALDTTAIFEGRDVGTVGVFMAELDGQSLTFSRSEGDTFVDAETGSSWDIDGVAIDGPLQGSRLNAVQHLDTFWFAIAAFEPETRIVDAEE